ncbi:hypothetical protein [Caballeronia sordidicola]|uniref:hypothetical protein n=1 Tax=Caballeronia sordidicola TaxID=196367 RepID=UPI00211AF8AD|nr:hypothetical protein [Caballeronia sordidicola]
MASLSESCTEEPSNVHRLVIVEGIMGSGKSTTMRFIAKHLQEAGRPAVHIHERTNPHPVRATDELEHWFEPWRDTTPEDLADRALARWTAFVEYTQSSTDIPVLDGQLFHGDLTHLLLMEADTALIWGYIRKLATVIAPLNPFVVYLWQEDVEEAIITVCAERAPNGSIIRSTGSSRLPTACAMVSWDWTG